MPLPEPARRQPIHTRDIVCQGYRRADGLWDIEAHLTDVKSYDFQTEQRGVLKPGDPVHDMWLRLTLDTDFTVHAVEACLDKSPFVGCDTIVSRYQCLVGLNIGKGWTRAVKERLGGVGGCTHLMELLLPIATTAFQTIYPIRAREAAEKAKAAETGGGDGVSGKKARPALLDMCHIFASDGDVARRLWPEHYTGDFEAAEAAD